MIVEYINISIVYMLETHNFIRTKALTVDFFPLN